MQAFARHETAELTPEEEGRQAVYLFLSRVLAAPAKRAELANIAPLAGDEAPLNQAFLAFRREVEKTDRETMERHYHDLFIGVGRGELLPFASYYLTGFLHEKPLAELRADLEALGFARAPGTREPEDHMAMLCEIMARLVAGTGEGEFDIYDQDRFFGVHLKPWARKFFADLESARTAGPYRHVGRIGVVFMGIEEEGFGMIARA